MAAEVDDNSTAPLDTTGDRPLVVRIKRKAFHSPVEAFWLEINERPFKRPLIDFEKLSISDSAKKEELKTRRVFVKHVDTVSSSEATVEVLKTCVKHSHDDGSRSKANDGSQRQLAAKASKQDQLLSKAKQEQETLAKSARFKQIWTKRMRNKEGSVDETLHELCHLYDVVRVDAEETRQKEKQQEKMSKEDEEYLAKFLPLLREHMPDAAEQIESDISSSTAGRDGYVYDLYTIGESMDESDDPRPYPLIQVDDDDDGGWYDGPDDSDCESYDSNGENHPLNDYPDEMSDEDEEESVATNDDESGEEGETGSDESTSSAEDENCGFALADDEMHSGFFHVDDFFGDDGGDDEDWRWDRD